MVCMSDGCMFSRRLAWSARILASHDMGPYDAPVRLRWTCPNRTLSNKLQRHARIVLISSYRNVNAAFWSDSKTRQYGLILRPHMP